MVQATLRHPPLWSFSGNWSAKDIELAMRLFRFVVGCADYTVAKSLAIKARFTHSETLVPSMIVHENTTLHVIGILEYRIACKRSRHGRNRWDAGGRKGRFTIIPFSSYLVVCAGVAQVTFRHPPLVRIPGNRSATDAEFAVRFFRFVVGSADNSVALILAIEGRFTHFKALVPPMIVHEDAALHVIDTREYGIGCKRSRRHFVSL
jgi:hypothetical protein